MLKSSLGFKKGEPRVKIAFLTWDLLNHDGLYLTKDVQPDKKKIIMS